MQIKRWKNIVGLIIIVMYFPVMFSFVSSDKDRVVCGEIISTVCDSVDNRFIETGDIINIVLEKHPGILGRKINEVNCNQMEAFLENHPAIKSCETYFTYNGTLHIDVMQREPMVRVFNSKQSYYLDVNGEKMPKFKKHTAHVLVASGYVDRLSSYTDLVHLSKTIYNDVFWKAQIEQVYVNKNGEFILVPRVGDHIIVFGSLEDVDIKFRNLKALYKTGWEAREWNLYKKVNVKYKGQVVCTKV